MGHMTDAQVTVLLLRSGSLGQSRKPLGLLFRLVANASFKVGNFDETPVQSHGVRRRNEREAINLEDLGRPGSRSSGGSTGISLFS